MKNHRTTRSETAVISVDRELPVFVRAAARRHRALIIRNCAMEREERHILLSRLCKSANHFSGSRYFSEIMRRFIHGVREDDMLQALELSSFMGGFVDALPLQYGRVSKTELHLADTRAMERHPPDLPSRPRQHRTGGLESLGRSGRPTTSAPGGRLVMMRNHGRDSARHNSCDLVKKYGGKQ